MTRVDVIVPVEGEATGVRACLDSLLAAPQATPFDLVVVNDALAGAELSQLLQEKARDGLITLLTHATPRGFAASVNRAVDLHHDRDVVVVHCGAEVANDWLDRLTFHAAGASDVGTVTSFAGSAAAAGYPRMDGQNALPEGHTVASLDLLFRRANGGRSIAIPFGYGPCVYIRRECLSHVGVFDDALLGGPFGVEQDFSLRAASAGFRNLLAADVYVGHRGEVVAGAAVVGEAAASAEAVLGRLYPHYAVRRSEFISGDPARPYRRSVDLLRLRESRRQVICFIAHAWGGGIRRHMVDLAALLDGRCEVLLIEPVADNTIRLSWFKEGEDFAAYFVLPGDTETLVSLLQALGVARLHFHHVHGLPPSVVDLPRAMGVPYDCTLHDHYAICPQYHLVTENGDYCGEPDAAGCAACLARRPGQWDLDIGAWRSVFGKLLRGADRVLAPSRDVAQRVARYFPDLRATVVPHPEPGCRTARRVVRVALLGNLSPEKGLHVVAACAADARDRDLPLVFRVLGSTTGPIAQWPEAPLWIQGQYAEEELQSLIEAERPDVIWFPAQVPETYSYTLSGAMANDIPIVASSLGALPERLAGYSRSILVPWDASAAQWNEALSAAGGAYTVAGRPFPRIAVS